MKAAHIRIEVSKGDTSKDVPWVMLVRTIQRDKVQTVHVQRSRSPRGLLERVWETDVSE